MDILCAINVGKYNISLGEIYKQAKHDQKQGGGGGAAWCVTDKAC